MEEKYVWKRYCWNQWFLYREVEKRDSDARRKRRLLEERERREVIRKWAEETHGWNEDMLRGKTQTTLDTYYPRSGSRAKARQNT